MLMFRLASAAEVETAVEVWEAANPGHSLPAHPGHLRSWARDPASRLFVAVEGGRLVAMALAVAGRAGDGAGELVPELTHLTGVAVRPDSQHRGVGTGLLEFVVHRLQVDGISRLTLWTHEGNRAALEFFEVCDFRPTGRTGVDESGRPMVHLEAEVG